MCIDTKLKLWKSRFFTSRGICLNTAQLARFFQDLWNARGLYAEFLEHVRSGNVFAKNYFVVEETMLLTFSERRETRQWMHARFFYHRHQIASARIIPAEERQVRTLRIADSVP